MGRTVAVSLTLLLSLASAARAADALAFDTATFRIELTPDGRLERFIDRATGRDQAAPHSRGPLFALRKNGRTHEPTAVVPYRTLWGGRRLRVEFADASVTARLRVRSGHAFVAFTLLSLSPAEGIEEFRLCRVGTAIAQQVASAPNAAYNDQFAVAVMGLAPHVRATTGRSSFRATSPGVSQRITRETKGAKQGPACLRYQATNPSTTKVGWAHVARHLPRRLDLSRHRVLALWLHGDGKGQAFKVQLRDDRGGWRDDYVTVDFTGWRYVELATPADDRLDYTRVAYVNLYYNNLPRNATVCCLADDLRAIPAPRGKSAPQPGDIVLAPFDEPDGPYIDTPTAALSATALAKHGPLVGSGAAIVAAPRDQFTKAIAEMERACGLPSPRLSGTWSKESPDVRRSYLFITRFGEADTDAVIAAMKRAGFTYVLIGQGSWSRSTGHHAINTANFPRGRRSLRAVVRRFHRAGIKVGLHFLAAGISPRDPYVTPVPDPRLVRDASATLAKPIDAKADRIVLAESPTGFPDEDGGYKGSGTVVQIGHELIRYTGRALTPPYALTGCERGYHKTQAAAHPAGARVDHLLRAYGYFLHDADSTLTDEVARRVARVANYIDADMLYFDGSERLQGPHWLYNAKIQMAYVRHLRRRDVLLQGSSYSHFSWHALSRHASADGHGDLKGYLDERLPAFKGYARNFMPLDLGWYYIYDPALALDQFEYVLGKSLGFGCSISLQTNPKMLRTYPRMAEILDLVAAYETARLDGRFPDAALAALRTPRTEFRLRRNTLTRAIYEPQRMATKPDAWSVANTGPAGPCQLAGEISLGHIVRPGAEYHGKQSVLLADFADLARYTYKGTSPGVTQAFERVAAGGPSGGPCLRYSATNPAPAGHGWSVLGSTREPVLDLSVARGVGYWLKGSGADKPNALFKVQLGDGKGHWQDYYTRTNFDGWRYIQLERPKGGTLDWSHIARVNFYYNGLPPKSTVTVHVQGVRAISALHAGALDCPQLTVGARTITFPIALAPGQVLVFGPDGAVVRGPGGVALARAPIAGGPIKLARGANPIRLACRGAITRAVRVRLARLYPGESYKAKGTD